MHVHYCLGAVAVDTASVFEAAFDTDFVDLVVVDTGVANDVFILVAFT